MKIDNKKLIQMRIKEPIKSYVSVLDEKLYLYGDIGDYWEGVTLDKLQIATRSMDKSKVTVHINSYGGDAMEGVAIRNFLKNTFEHIDVIIDGIAASSASVVATCGDTLTMLTGTTYMIHNPWMFTYGDKKELQKAIGALEAVEKSYIDVYMERFKGTEAELKQLLDDEAWLTADEAEALGFADATAAEPEDTQKPESENQLVASLFKKYVAKAKVEEPEEPIVEPKNNDEVIENVENEPNAKNILNNLIKTFSQN